MQKPIDPARDIVVVHSSDLHVDHDYTARLHGGDGTAGLACVLNAARSMTADVVILAGDTFDCHRLPASILDQTADVITAAELPVVVLPGNHDPRPAMRCTAAASWPRLKICTSSALKDDAVVFPELALEVWGRPHRDYDDMIPFEIIRPRRTRWQIAVGHGHYEPAPDRSISPRPSWLIGDADIAATGADYIALGHWNRAVRVGNGTVPAYYSGSPEYAGTVNVVRLKPSGEVEVIRAPLDIARELPG